MEPYLYLGISPMFVFLVGVVAGLGLVGLWRGILLWADRRATQKVVDTLLGQPYGDNPQDQAAYERVEACKKRLRWQKTPNPEWIAPLVEETPKLIREIAEIYYPDAEEPIRAPGLSHFARAIHFAAMDIADATVTVVLIGPCTWQRKHVDWEIGSSLRKTKNNSRCGLLGILLPNHPNFRSRTFNPRLIPPRLADNCKGDDPYACIYRWSGSPNEVNRVCRWIHQAFKRIGGTPPNNSRLPFGDNWSGDCSVGWQN